MRTIEGFFFLVEGTKDKIIWAPVSSGRFSCRSFRKSIAREGQYSDNWKRLWSLPVSLKVRCFMWLLLQDSVAVKDRIHSLELFGRMGI